MHLLTAQPGGYVDDEGIIDLNQDAADIVILSAADSSLAALSEAYQYLPQDFPTLRLANWMQLLKPAAYDLYEHKVLRHARVIVLSLLGGASYWRYGLEQLEVLCADQKMTLIVVPGDDALDSELLQASTVTEEQAQHYWHFLRQGGAKNLSSLFLSLGVHFFNRNENYYPPEVLPDCLIYSRTAGQVSLNEWQRGQVTEESTVLLLFYKSHLQSGNRKMFDELVTLIQDASLNVLPVAVSSLKDKSVIALINHWITETKARVVLNTTGFASHFCDNETQASSPSVYTPLFADQVPVLQLIVSSTTEEDWQAQTIGLRSRDVAMHVVLPEMDGRIITRPISFKSQAFYDEACQIDVIHYQLQHERAGFVIALAKQFIQLNTKNNVEKRIALVLANYPTQDGRIGNGVGLDTPQSTLNILQALHENGYLLSEIPASGNALIEKLMTGVTNNVSMVSVKGCWQSMSVEDYQVYFDTLPTENQQAILDRWGTVDQDVKYRNGRIMIAGFRLDNVFVGIQPARGFNIDLNANYHDPDLVPPHSYLAFYFWLRHVYKIDAAIHVGKHGNLEWLPGKGTGLSQTCWPDAVFGPIPHFYPFIVNDPGEGSQAKRRTQAVIIDHLMPPIGRAETYGELYALEDLVDEYYQALGIDENRLTWLKKQILETVKNTHLIEELPASARQNNETLLAGLDTYLCDIKEAQIRQGLHILGQLPADDNELIETIVALVRLPRGNKPEEQGILHNLVLDFGLKIDGQLFDPLQKTVVPWDGVKPDELVAVCASDWRTSADTRERLELFASQLIRWLLQGEGLPFLPQTRHLLTFINKRLYPALQESVHAEIQSLMKGLNGCFVEPGPSGAPTRGRLDTLPTGKNFYAVDNRAIPSKAAWALGQKSADALIARHLQDHGDYPKQLGLSVWGTATMRTGGDDIAQAFSLMGIEPVWAEGSSRVIDFTIIPAMQLGRPRVDVTLRVSGFFRDAFMNVMRLFDAAVNALAEFDEPGTGNTIQKNIERRIASLVAEGSDRGEAIQQARYRVFGSKPGAYGAGLQGLIDEKCWEEAGDLADAYLNWGGYAYTKENQTGVKAREAFAHQLTNIDTVVQNQDNREHDILDSDDYYQFQGGMANAIHHLSGDMPDVYLNDHSNPASPTIRTLKEEINRVLRSRVLNPKWINGMQKHGYKGAFEMAASVDYLFAYDATTDLVDSYQYENITETLLLNPDNQQFLKDNNPEALKEMGERLLEAMARGLWQDENDYQDKLCDLLNSLEDQLEQI